METVGTFVSGMQEEWNAFSQSLTDPKFLVGFLLAVLVLVYLHSIGRAVNRLHRQLFSAMEEVGEIRSALREIEKSLDRTQPKPPQSDGRNQDIRNVPFR